jgi:hypothetical protein
MSQARGGTTWVGEGSQAGEGIQAGAVTWGGGVMQVGFCLEGSLFPCCMCLTIGSSRSSIRLCPFARLLSCPIWVVIGSMFTVGLPNVLSHKRAVNFTIEVLVNALYPHSHGGLRPRVLIGANVFLFQERGTVASQEKLPEPRLNHFE